MLGDSRLRPELVAGGTGRTVRLALAESLPGGTIDGAWWPYSRDLGVEAPALLAALQERWHIGAVGWVAAGRAAWDRCPPQIRVDGRWVRLRLLGMLDGRLLTVNFPDGDRIQLFVVPPNAPPDVATMALTAGAGGRMTIDRRPR